MFGMTAREVFEETPEWELEVLIEQWNAEQNAARDAQRGR